MLIFPGLVIAARRVVLRVSPRREHLRFIRSWAAFALRRVRCVDLSA